MKNTLKIAGFFFLTINFCQGQNLVPNPGFEIYSNEFCGIMWSSEFNGTMIDWINPSGGAPQVFFTNNADTCYNHQPTSLYDGPIGIKGSQIPHSGNVMVGLWLYTISDLNQRQYVQTELITPMIAGHTYRVEFYVSLADSMEKSIDKIGAYLSAYQINSGSSDPLNYSPQIVAEDFIDDAVNWVLISDTIWAEDDYAYITIGNFYNDNATNTIENPLSSGAPGTYGAFYFLDDVKIEEINTTGTNEINVNDFSVFPTMVIDELTITLLKKSSINIYNSLGQVVFSKQQNNGVIKVNMSGFSKGVYIVSIQNNNGFISRKVIK
ncbi:T9SS type A sorting domain-containing protein [Cryomorpha ignava]|uniref:T9SS type A sorting domain-containing protein n=1 Tax=Cryomorpha ignava TaxID=101383 RepID=A0A7K3WXS7_9FLAO|nr:T9SS type A sorting domain-containing protein [Cryomorpha ignava]NEN25445.1 T9SS type A sorting domain-containing protein [Cryomorpha ignava]